jgi:PiT family inorganic phosphate transporter
MASPVSDVSVLAAKPKAASLLDEKLARSRKRGGRWSLVLFGLLTVAGLAYIGLHVELDLARVHLPTMLPYLLLGVALVIALGFEFVNGFHDTANAVATVIYTHSLEPNVAVVFSGVLNFVGVLFSSGAVAYTIIMLLPVELILKVSHGAGFSMVFALLVAAILWNLGTWWMGLPSSSSHTMIGSIIGVGVAHQLMEGGHGASGVAMEQIIKVFRALVLSPIVGFAGAALVFLLFKLLSRDPRMFKAPEGTAPPPLYIRALLILTCGGVSYAHGSNDGQKGMGLIMLILVGTVPTAYALNHAVGAGDMARFTAMSSATSAVVAHHAPQTPAPANKEAALESFLTTKHFDPSVLSALDGEIDAIRAEATGYGSLGALPDGMQTNVRNQMYLTGESLKLLPTAKGAPELSAAEKKTISGYTDFLDRSTRYIPTWVKVAVALALGLGTMVGWKRIVVTVGERIGKQHLTYAQGAAAGLMTMATILGADRLGLPVSTTHVLSSGVAGSMVANGSGLRLTTVRNIALAWVFTLPAAALLSGALYALFHHMVR